MPKRSAEEKIEKYQRKLRRLEDQRLQEFDEYSYPTREYPTNEEYYDIPVDPPPTPGSPDPIPEPIIPPDLPPAPVEVENITNVPVPETNPEQEKSQVPNLDPDLLLALGDGNEDDPKFGPNIHPNLAERWLPLLRKGLTKECKDKLFKDYLIPENCPLLKAPKLNLEIHSAIIDLVRNRDRKIETTQQQLGVGLSAINKGLTVLLTGEDKLSAIKHLSDGCRVLSDLHHMQSYTRIKLLTPALAKPFLNVIQDTERDETLFGSKHGEKITASKAIEKQGLQIKKPATNPKSSTTASSSSTVPRAHQYQGNWQGPPRYPSNRGGRGGLRKVTAMGAARKPAPAPQSRFAGQSRYRPAAQP